MVCLGLGLLPTAPSSEDVEFCIFSGLSDLAQAEPPGKVDILGQLSTWPTVTFMFCCDGFGADGGVSFLMPLESCSFFI